MTGQLEAVAGTRADLGDESVFVKPFGVPELLARVAVLTGKDPRMSTSSRTRPSRSRSPVSTLSSVPSPAPTLVPRHFLVDTDITSDEQRADPRRRRPAEAGAAAPSRRRTSRSPAARSR